MESQPWLNRVRERLVRQLLPPSYVQRFMDELTDHVADLKEEGMDQNPASRLGEPEQVAEAAVAAYRQRSFLGRHPVAAFLVFAISPVIPWCVLSVALQMVFQFFFHYTWNECRWIDSLAFVAFSTVGVILYSELALWLGIGRKWTLISCPVLASLSVLCEGIGLHPFMSLVQFAAPFVVGGWIIKWKCDSGYAATKFTVFAVSPVVSYTLLLALAPWIANTARLFECIRLATNDCEAWWLTGLVYLVIAVVPSLLYGKLARWSCVGRKWMLVPYMVLALYGEVVWYAAIAWNRVLMTSLFVGVPQVLVPLLVGLWFLRRKRDQGQLQLAA